MTCSCYDDGGDETLFRLSRGFSNVTVVKKFVDTVFDFWEKVYRYRRLPFTCIDVNGSLKYVLTGKGFDRPVFEESLGFFRYIHFKLTVLRCVSVCTWRNVRFEIDLIHLYSDGSFLRLCPWLELCGWGLVLRYLYPQVWRNVITEQKPFCPSVIYSCWFLASHPFDCIPITIFPMIRIVLPNPW